MEVESKLMTQQRKNVKKYLEFVFNISKEIMTPKEHIEYIANAIEKSKAFLNSNNPDFNRMFNAKSPQDFKHKDNAKLKHNLEYDKDFMLKKEKFYSPIKRKQRKEDLKDTYNNGLNRQFEILNKLKQKLQKHHIKTFRSRDLDPLSSEGIKSIQKIKHEEEFSDRKILKLSKREDILSSEDILKINKHKQNLMGTRYFFLSSESKKKIDTFAGQEPKLVEKLHYYKKYINRNNPISLKSGRKGSKERKLSQTSNETINNSK